MKEISNGVYESDPGEYQGQIGRSYRLLVTIPDGNQFESGWEVMNESPPIDEIKNNFEQRIPTDPSLLPVKGIQFYLNSAEF